MGCGRIYCRKVFVNKILTYLSYLGFIYGHFGGCTKKMGKVFMLNSKVKPIYSIK